MLNYCTYYVSQVLANAILLSAYIVQACYSHHPCLTKSGQNITLRFELSFKLGLIVIFLDSLNSSVVEIYLRSRVQFEERDFHNGTSSSTMRRAMISIVIGWVLKCAILAISSFQVLVLRSNYGQYCINSLGVLGLEAQWMYALVSMQTFKVVVFTVWWYWVTYAGLESRNTYNRESLGYAKLPIRETASREGHMTARMHDIARDKI